jgi:hypothetical protein
MLQGCLICRCQKHSLGKEHPILIINFNLAINFKSVGLGFSIESLMVTTSNCFFKERKKENER